MQNDQLHILESQLDLSDEAFKSWRDHLQELDDDSYTWMEKAWAECRQRALARIRAAEKRLHEQDNELLKLRLILERRSQAEQGGF